MSAETFEALLTANLPGVRRFVQKRLGPSGDAEDIVQEVLMRAFLRRHQLRVQAKFRSWLWSIAMNEIRMFFRRDRGHLSLDERAHIDSRDGALSPLASFEQTELREWLLAAMAKLSARDRAAIRLRDLDGLTLSEAAQALECSEPAAKSILFRARRRLAHALLATPRFQSAASPRAAGRFAELAFFDEGHEIGVA